jgi:hypothetical protein
MKAPRSPSPFAPSDKVVSIRIAGEPPGSDERPLSAEGRERPPCPACEAGEVFTGARQRVLARIIADYAKVLSLGELQAAIRLGKPDVFDKTCILCDAKLGHQCTNPECLSNQKEKP